MLNVEPPHTPYDVHFRLLGFAVRVHPFYWLVTILLALQGRTTAIDAFLWVSVAFVSILIHELGHAFAFRYFGRRAHIVLHSFGGLAIPDAEYNSYQQRSSHGNDPMKHILISLAGPGAGFLLALLVAGICQVIGHSIVLQGWFLDIEPEFANRNLRVLVLDLMYINIFWGLLNLLPIYPLDGGQVAREILRILSPFNGLQQSLVLSAAVAAGAAVLCVFRFDNIQLAIMFGLLAFINYQQLQQLSGGGYGGSEW